MSVSAVVKDGKIQESMSASSLAQATDKGNSSVNKDDFLQLLVAQMKYQDPLEPTSNTEWVSQYATFSELEEMQNMAGSLELSRASSYVGKTVQLSTTDAQGNTQYVQGNVDYVTYEAGKAYLSVNGNLYSLNDLLNVVDPEYLEAGEVVANFVNEMAELPKLEDLTLEDKEQVDKIKELFEAMNEHQKSFLPEDTETTVKGYINRMNALVEAKEKEENADTDSEDASEEADAEKTENTEEA